MSFSSMSAAERNAVISAAIVVIAGFISVVWDWGQLFILAPLAGLGALFVLFQARIAPTMTLPGSKGSFLTALGIVAAVVSVLTALYWLSYITSYLVDVTTLVFLVALIGSFALAWFGWQILTAEGGKFRFGTAAPTQPAPVAPQTQPAETPPVPTSET